MIEALALQVLCKHTGLTDEDFIRQDEYPNGYVFSTKVGDYYAISLVGDRILIDECD